MSDAAAAVGNVGSERAGAVVAAVIAGATASGRAVSVAVVDAVGTLVAFGRMDGAPRYSADFAVGKARTAATFRVETSALEALYADRPAFAVSFVAQGGYFLGRGGVPLVESGVVVGGVGVSGADAHGEEELARAAAAGG